MEDLLDQLPPEVEQGIALINQGKYFQAHEILELAWINEKKVQRQLYRGLVQVSALLYHMERENNKGVLKLLPLALENITPFMSHPSRIDIPRLVSDLITLTGRLESAENNKSVSMLPFGLIIHTRDREF